MSGFLSEHGSQPIGQYSTPQSDVKTLSCSLSSISDERSSAVKRVKSGHKHNVNHQDEETNFSGSDTDGIFGDIVREHVHIPLDIQSDGMKQLFHRADDLICQKRTSTIFGDFPRLSLLDDDVFDGIVGQHRRKYKRIHFYNGETLLKEKPSSSYSVADSLWKNFIGEQSSSNPQTNKKLFQLIPYQSERKFFKTRHQVSEQKKRMNEALVKKKKVKSSLFGYSGLFMPSLKRPLGWMAIKGVGHTERIEVCDRVSHFLADDELESYQPLTKRKKSHDL